MQLNRRQRGFTLVEMAVAFSIIALLMGSALVAFAGLIDSRNIEETNRRLNAAIDGIVGFAVVNRRLPCPAVAGATGTEAPAGGGTCTNSFSGFLPGITIGYTPVDANGYAIDTWGNPIRYVIATSGSAAMTGCTGTANLPHLTSSANLKANGVSCRPGPTDLDVCLSTTGTTGNSCGTATRVAAQGTIAFIVYSTGKNTNEAANQGTDELENTDNDSVFVTRPAATAVSASTGNFDDLMVYVPIGVLYSKLIAAGVLP